MKTAILLLLATGLCRVTICEDITRRVYHTCYTADPPAMDGRLDDPVWDQVKWQGDFTQRTPIDGAAPGEDTQFKILYSDRALYVAVRCSDQQSADIADMLARHDAFPGDWVEVNLDSRHDYDTGFSFTLSASEVRGDEYISSDNNWNGSWNPVWTGKTHIDGQGWSAEFRIPFSQLRYDDLPEHVWGLQVSRRIHRLDERSSWQHIPRNVSGWCSRLGELRGLGHLPRQTGIELLPFARGQLELDESIPGDVYADGRNSEYAVGLDAKLSLPGDFTLDLSVNPDFGQVEADPAEVNLTEFESRLSENRPLFIEGQNLFSFAVAPTIASGIYSGDNLFYSRRIGAAPSLYLLPGEGQSVDQPESVNILGAAKLTGRTSSGISLGLLDCVCAPEHAELSTTSANGYEKQEMLVEPATNYCALRLQSESRVSDRRLAFFGTMVHRRLKEEQLRVLHRQALSGGLDYLQRWDNRNWFFRADFSASRVMGEQDALFLTQTSSQHNYHRVGDEHLSVSPRTSLVGHGGNIRLVKCGGFLQFESGLNWRSPGLELNDLGYMRQANLFEQENWIGLEFNEPTRFTHSWSLNTNIWHRYTYYFEHLQDVYNLNASFNFVNRWSTYLNASRFQPYTSLTNLRGGPAMLMPGRWSFDGNLHTDQSKKLNFGFGGGVKAEEGNHLCHTDVWCDIDLRVSDRLALSVNPSLSRDTGNQQYLGSVVSDDASVYFVSRLEQRAFSLTTRVECYFSPRLTLQYYLQPFVFSGVYSRPARVLDPRAPREGQRLMVYHDNQLQSANGEWLIDEDLDGVTDYQFVASDFNYVEFNSNLVLRWEFAAGSTCYVVWSQGRQNIALTDRFEVGSDLDRLFDEHPRNVFLIKISKWLNV